MNCRHRAWQRTSYPLALVLLLAGVSAPDFAPAAQAQSHAVVVDRYERWTLYWGGVPGKPNKSALLVLFVRNTTDRLVVDWKAILVARDSTGREMFWLAVKRDSADIAPGEVQRVELRFDNDLRKPGEPYDHLMGTDTSNIFVSFDEVRVTLGPPVRQARSGSPVCYDRAAFDRLAAARASRDTSFAAKSWWLEHCQLLMGETPVIMVQRIDSVGWLVRFKRTQRTGWILTADLLNRQ